MIKITNKQLADSVDAIGVIARARDGVEPGNIQKLARWLRKLNGELEGFNEARNELLKRFWKCDEQGERLPEFQTEKQDAFDDALKKFMAEEIELKLPKLDLAILGKKPLLNVGQQMALDWWIQPEPEAEDEDASEAPKSE